LTELVALLVGVSWRMWRVPIFRSFWFGEAAAYPAVVKARPSGPSTYACHFDVAPDTHPQAIMHEVLTRVTAGWRAAERKEWSVCSAAPFKEVPGVANNVGVMNYSFPIEPACSVGEFRAQLGRSKWQVPASAAANRTLAGKSGVSVAGIFASRLVPDFSVGRSMLDALFSFMAMKLDQTEAVHLYSTNEVFSGEGGSYSRQKAFIAAAYDKTTGRVHVTLVVNLDATELPEEAALRGAGFEPFERFGPFHKTRLARA